MELTDQFYPQVKCLWMAMTDWPFQLKDTNEWLKTLHMLAGKNLTKKNCIAYHDKLLNNLWLPWNSWKAESMTSLIELFDYYPDATTFDEVLERIIIAAKDKLKSIEPD